MKFFDLKKSLKEGAKPIYFLFGDDQYFIKRSVELIKQAYVSCEELDYAHFDLQKPAPDYLSMLVTSLQSSPFLSEKRLVFAENLSVSAKDFEKALLWYFNNPSPTGILVITAGEKNAANFKKHKNVCLVDCNRADVKSLSRYVYTEFIKEEATITAEAAKKLAEYTGGDFYRLSSETQKLIDYSKKYGEIDSAAIDDTIAPETEYKLWEFADAAAKKQFEKAVKILDDLASKGMGLTALLYRLYSVYKNMFEIAVSGQNDGELASELKIKEYAVKMLRLQASAYTKKRLRESVEYLADTDAVIKSGEKQAAGAVFAALAQVCLL